MSDAARLARQSPGTDRPARAPVGRWVLLCGAAEVVGMTAAAGTAKLSSGLGDAPTVTAWGLVVAGGLVEGLALAVAQAAGLADWLPHLRRARFVVMTVVVAGLGWAGASARSTLASPDGTAPPLAVVLVGAAALGLVMGALVGAAQASVLRDAARHPGRWVGANAVAWPVAMTVIFLGATAPGADWPLPGVLGLGAATGAVAGGLLGLVLGWFVPSLDGGSPHNRLVLALLASPLHGIAGRSLVGLRIRGRVSGRWFELPVTYASDLAGLVVVPARPERKRWWRNLRTSADVAVLRGGRWDRARAVALFPGDDGYLAAVATYRGRWPRVVVPPTCPVVRISVVESERRW